MPESTNPSDPPASEGEEPGDLPFEEALGQLEELVRDMEAENVPLEELMEKYEQGTRLHRICEKRLDEAQGRIEIIRKKRDGSAELEAFGEKAASGDRDTPDADEPAQDRNDESSQQDGELF